MSGWHEGGSVKIKVARNFLKHVLVLVFLKTLRSEIDLKEIHAFGTATDVFDTLDMKYLNWCNGSKRNASLFP